MTAAEKILQKALVASDIPSSEWSKIQAGLRDRAFFSAKVTEAKFLYAARQGVSKIAASNLSPSEVRRDLRSVLSSVGYQPEEGQEGSLQDLTSKRRLDLIIKTNVDQAKGYVSHLRATSGGAYLAFPAYELIRVEERNLKRDWSSIWRSAASRVSFEGVARGTSRFVAFKTSPIWKAISRFGNPFPPFDFNSGMGLRDVSKTECIELGLLKPSEEPPTPKTPGFNDNLSSTVPFDDASPNYAALRKTFGDQIQFNRETREIKWRSELFSEMFDPGHEFSIKLGQTSQTLIEKLPKSVSPDTMKGAHLTINERWLDKKRRDKITDHRIHFEEMEDHPEDIPLKKGDVDMLPSLWRNPDRVFEDKGDLVLEVDAIDGGMFRAIVKPRKSPVLKTFYRTTESWEDYLKKRMARHK